MLSIRQNLDADALPHFRNLGVVARVLILVKLLSAAWALLDAASWATAIDAIARNAALIEPPLIASLLVLYVAARWLLRVPYLAGCAVIVAVALAFVWTMHAIYGE